VGERGAGQVQTGSGDGDGERKSDGQPRRGGRGEHGHFAEEVAGTRRGRRTRPPDWTEELEGDQARGPTVLHLDSKCGSHRRQTRRMLLFFLSDIPGSGKSCQMQKLSAHDAMRSHGCNWCRRCPAPRSTPKQRVAPPSTSAVAIARPRPAPASSAPPAAIVHPPSRSGSPLLIRATPLRCTPPCRLIHFPLLWHPRAHAIPPPTPTMAAFIGAFPPVGAASLSATRGGSAFVCARPAPVVAATPAKARWTMMPIGVPKVAYRVPGAPSADWVDIYNRLYRERIIFLGQEIDDEVGGGGVVGVSCGCNGGGCLMVFLARDARPSQVGVLLEPWCASHVVVGHVCSPGY